MWIEVYSWHFNDMTTTDMYCYERHIRKDQIIGIIDSKEDYIQVIIKDMKNCFIKKEDAEKLLREQL